jgi:hypothetical protein
MCKLFITPLIEVKLCNEGRRVKVEERGLIGNDKWFVGEGGRRREFRFVYCLVSVLFEARGRIIIIGRCKLRSFSLRRQTSYPFRQHMLIWLCEQFDSARGQRPTFINSTLTPDVRNSTSIKLPTSTYSLWKFRSFGKFHKTALLLLCAVSMKATVFLTV